MDLKTSLPQNAPADIVYSLPANFTCKGDKMDGHFCVTKEKIYVYNGSEITLEYGIQDFSEFECKLTRKSLYAPNAVCRWRAQRNVSTAQARARQWSSS